MRTMTKSGLRVARETLAVGQRALPRLASHFSRKDFTLPQLFALLVVRKFLKLDYRGAATLVSEWSDLRRTLGLNKTPHYTTLYYAERKLLEKGVSIDSCPPALIKPEIAA